MIEISGFDKLQRDIARQAQKMLETIAKDYANIFSMLPNYFQASLDKLLPKKFEQFLGNIAAPVNMKNFPNNYWEAKGQTNTVNDQVAAVQSAMQINAKRQERDETAFNELIKEAKSQEDINDLLGIRNGLNDQYSKTNYYLIALEDKLLSLLDLSFQKKRAIVGLNQSMLNNQRQQIAAQITQNRIQQAFGTRVPFGVHPATMQTNFKNFFGRYTTVKGILTEIGIIVGRIIQQVGEVYMALRRGGMDASQAFSEFGTVVSSTAKGWHDGVLATPKEFAQATAVLANNLGDIKVPDAAVDATVKMTKLWGVASEAAGHLVSQITRFSHFSATAADNALILARSMAAARNLPVGSLMKSLADNADLFANYAGLGFQEFAKSAATAMQMGISLRDSEGAMDRMSTDFEGTLMAAAKIQTILPKFNMDELQYISLYGSTDQFDTALHNAFVASGIRNLGQLNRSQQQMIANGLQLSREEIGNAIIGKKETGPTAEATAKSLADAKDEDIHRNWFTSVGDLVLGNKWLLGAVAAQTAALIANTAALLGSGFFKNLVSGAFFSKLWKGAAAPGSPIASVVGGAGGAAGGVTGLARIGGVKIPIIGGLIAGGIDAFEQHKQGQTLGKSVGHGAIAGGSVAGGAILGAEIGSIVPGIGTAIGAILGGLGGQWLGGKVADQAVGMAPGIATAMTPELANAAAVNNAVNTHTQNNYSADGTKIVSPVVDTSKVEDLLQKLIRAVEAGHIIVMDGREVGKGILNSYAHGN